MGDANADAMERMKVNGDDLARLRDVDFTVVFPNVSAAKEFAEHFRSLGHRLPWSLVVPSTNFRGML
jgi:hypothetical protein